MAWCVPADVEIGNIEELAKSYRTLAPEMRAISCAKTFANSQENYVSKMRCPSGAPYYRIRR